MYTVVQLKFIMYIGIQCTGNYVYMFTVYSWNMTLFVESRFEYVNTSIVYKYKYKYKYSFN